jgi:hypothetical protein
MRIESISKRQNPPKLFPCKPSPEVNENTRVSTIGVPLKMVSINTNFLTTDSAEKPTTEKAKFADIL